MPQLPESAAPIKLALVNSTIRGRKIRVAGRVLCYDPASSLLLLLDKDVALLVDVSLCVSQGARPWLRERLSIIMVIGHVEVSEIELPIPTLPPYSPAPAIDPQVVLQALLVIPTPDLDLNAWNTSIIDVDDASPYSSEPFAHT